ncbi:EAL domain-containing protein [Solibacillus sp. FSL H8-0538]|uniref:EAL domain-containing protein n=1 Tax=Solibacillus sp. FSL H8-0538 TaxID=2921400 RepID=UPI0030F8D07F
MTKEQIYNPNSELLNLAPFPSFIVNLHGHVVDWNESNTQLFGYTTANFTSSSEKSITDTLFSPVREGIWHTIVQSTQTLRFDHIQVLAKNEQLIDVSIITKPGIFNNEAAVYILCLPTGLIRTLDDQQQLLMDLMNGIHSSFMMVTLDNEGFIINSNQQFLKASHWTPKRVLGKTIWQLFPSKESSVKIVKNIWKTLNNGQIWQGEVEKLTKDEQPYWVYLTAIPTISQNSENTRFLLIEKDITKDKMIQLQLEKIAYIDTETGLMNAHRLEQVITEMTADGRHFSFVYMSIDKFYTIKDLHDDNAGNNLILEFTKRLKMYFQDSTMARINENEFVVITPLPEWFTQGFLHYLQQHPIYNGNIAVPISISGGITRFPEDQSTFSQMMKASLATINTVRQAGGDSIVSLSKATHQALNRKSIVEKRLLLALDQKNLKVLYQPQLDLNTGKITAVEALVRWDDEVIGVVSPDELIPIAEETGLINNIGSFMIEKACEQALAWRDAGIDLKVSINSSVREFRDKNMAKSILETLERTGCPANLLQIEITEKFALEAEAETSIIKQMRALENKGIIFALDDFGTGYASFRYMQLLPIQILKIDQTFTNSLLKSEKSQQLMHGMVQFGKSMNLTVVAEGVETTEQRQLLASYGCDAVQGYFISKPVSEKEIGSLYKMKK